MLIIQHPYSTVITQSTEKKKKKKKKYQLPFLRVCTHIYFTFFFYPEVWSVESSTPFHTTRVYIYNIRFIHTIPLQPPFPPPPPPQDHRHSQSVSQSSQSSQSRYSVLYIYVYIYTVYPPLCTVLKVKPRDTSRKPVHSKSGRSSLEFCSHSLAPI